MSQDAKQSPTYSSRPHPQQEGLSENIDLQSAEPYSAPFATNEGEIGEQTEFSDGLQSSAAKQRPPNNYISSGVRKKSSGERPMIPATPSDSSSARISSDGLLPAKSGIDGIAMASPAYPQTPYGKSTSGYYKNQYSTPYSTPYSVQNRDSVYQNPVPLTTPNDTPQPFRSSSGQMSTPLPYRTPSNQPDHFYPSVSSPQYSVGNSTSPYSPVASPVATTPQVSQIRHRAVRQQSVQSPDVTRPYDSRLDMSKRNTFNTGTKIVRKLDVFPKLEKDMVVATEKGGLITLASYFIMAILVLAELVSWMHQNSILKEHVVVETALGKKMRINLNITFPALACEDLHVDVMDVAGDSQLDIADTFTKISLHLDGTPMGQTEVLAASERAKKRDADRRNAILKGLEPNYCGSCYGAEENEGQCCNTCDDVKAAYKKKRWNSDDLLKISEQCIREGTQTVEIKRMTKGEGCNIHGYMLVNRVAGNFHIAMGEAVERSGSHIHQFLPEDAPNFNASHVIHELNFGPKIPSGKEERGGLDGVAKYTTEENGITGLFQYFIKIVPTYYKGVNDDSSVIDSHRFFVTERFRPLMTESDEFDVDSLLSDSGSQPNVAGVAAGGKAVGTGAHTEHHKIQNAVLPGIFFVYDIYPFAVEIASTNVPLTHLLIRILALVGGVISITNLLVSIGADDKAQGGNAMANKR